jgi:hypothetical protein
VWRDKTKKKIEMAFAKNNTKPEIIFFNSTSVRLTSAMINKRPD